MKADTVNVRVELLRGLWEHVKSEHRIIASEYGNSEAIEDFFDNPEMWAVKELRDILDGLNNFEG